MERITASSRCRSKAEAQRRRLVEFNLKHKRHNYFLLRISFSAVKKKKEKLCEERSAVVWSECEARRQRSWSSEVKMAGDGKQLGGSATRVAVNAKRRCTQRSHVVQCNVENLGGCSSLDERKQSAGTSSGQCQSVAPSRTSSQNEKTPRRNKLCAHAHTLTHTHGHRGTKPSQTLNRAYNCIESVSEQSRGSTASSCRVQPETQTSQLLSSTDFVLGT
jgi:hypothetical protein